MQIIERNSFNVRSAVYRFRKADDALEFIVFPMIHIGSREFYNAVRQRLLKCDLILAEGVQSKKASLLTLSYRIVRRIKRMDLVTQQEALNMSDLSEKIVNSDMSGKSFDIHWNKLPMFLRLQLAILVPVCVIYLYLFGTRNVVAENMALDDLPSRDDVLDYDEEPAKLDSLLVEKRDEIVISSIEKVYQENRNEKKVVGIVYGAAHMRNIIHFLSEKLGYRIIGSEWLTVFDL